MIRLTLCFVVGGLLAFTGCDRGEAGAAAPNGDGNAEARTAAGRDAAAGKMQVEHAVCALSPIGESGVSGTIEFARDGDRIHVTGKITGLDPGKHGFHVHQFGDLTNRETGKSAGGHFNPTDQPHGRRDADERHVGDLGNITANEDGVAEVDITDDVIRLNGPHSIIGRALIVHAMEDQFTQPTGDAGSRVAGGVIGVAK